MSEEARRIVALIELEMSLTELLPRRYWWCNLFVSKRAFVLAALSLTAKAIQDGEHLR